MSRSTKRQRATTVLLSLLCVFVSVLGLSLHRTAVKRGEAAEVAATAAALAATSANWLDSDPALAVAIAQEAVRLDGSNLPVTAAALIRARQALARVTWRPGAESVRDSARIASGLAFSADGDEILAVTASGRGDTALQRWDVASMSRLPALPLDRVPAPGGGADRASPMRMPAEDGVTAEADGRTWHLGAAAESGRVVALGGATLGILDLPSEVWRQFDLPSGVTWASIAVTPDGGRVTAAGMNADGETIQQAWSLPAGDALGSGSTSDGEIDCMAYSPDGRQLITCGSDRAGEGVVRVQRASDGRLLHSSIPRHSGEIASMAIDPASAVIVTGGADGTIRFWNPETSSALREYEQAHDDPVSGIAFDREGSLMASAGLDGKVHFWDPRSGELVPEVIRPATPLVPLTAVALSPDGDTLAVADSDGVIRAWHRTMGENVAERLAAHASDQALPGHEGGTNAVEYLPQGKLATTGRDVDGRSGQLTVWDLAAETVLVQHGHIEESSEVSADSRTGRLAVGSQDLSGQSGALLVDASFADRVVPALEGLEGEAEAEATSRDGSLVAVGATDRHRRGIVRVWSTDDGQEAAEPIRTNEPITALAFDISGQRLVVATAGADGQGGVRLHNLSSRVAAGAGISLGTARVGTGVNDVALSPDGLLLATAGKDGVVSVHALDTRQMAAPALAGNQAEVTSVAFSDDGSMLASAGADGTLRLWDTTSWAALGVLAGDGPLTDVDFAPDGQQAATASVRGTVELWDVWSAEAACDLVRDLVTDDAFTAATSALWMTDARPSCDLR